MTMTMKNLFGALGMVAGVALSGTALAQDAAAAPADAAPPADAAAAPAADAAPAPAAEAAPAPAPDVAAAPPPAEAAPAAAPESTSSAMGANNNATPDAGDTNMAARTFGYPIYLSPQFTYTLADDIHHGKNGIGGTFAIGSRLLDWLALEGAATYSTFKNDSQFGGHAQLIGGGAHILLFPFVNFLPGFYGMLGGTYDHYKNQPVADTSPTGIAKHRFGGGSFIGGVGYWMPFSVFGMNAALRVEADYRGNEHKRYDTPIQGNQSVRPASESTRNNFSDALFNVGLVIPLFTPAPPPPAPPPPAEAPAVVPVAEAPPPPVEAPPPPPPPCRAPIAGEKVDLSGCASGDVIVLRGVNFDFNKATLTLNAKTILDQVVDALKAAPNIKVEIGGHTDGKGSEAYNLKLSQKRADAVKAYLVAHGVAADRMTTKGYGKGHPIADNGTDEGREQNRRVELKVTS